MWVLGIVKIDKTRQYNKQSLVYKCHGLHNEMNAYHDSFN